MISGISVCLTLWLFHVQGDSSVPATDPPVAQALSHGNYPWYDSKADSLKPVEPPSTPEWLDRISSRSATKQPVQVPQAKSTGSISISSIFIVALMVLVAFALVALFAWVSRSYMPNFEEPKPKRRPVSTVALIGGLPPGLPENLSDPLKLARELRARGDLAGAVLALFVHQVVTLDQLRLARLAPGRTARQLVRSIADPWVRARIEPTLRLFEVSYYGRRVPDVAAFDRAWDLAEEFEARAAQGAFVA